jgi:hypothetical protein
VMMIAQAFFETYGVEAEGIFRISAEKPVLDELVSKFDDGSPVDISSYAESSHTMAGLLKRYFREMPEPLIPFDLYEPFLRAVESGEMEVRALRLQKMVALLSKPRMATLQALMEILVSVTKKSYVNKMGAENLAVVFAPTLFRPAGLDLNQSMNDTPLTTCCVVLMIDFFDRIFPCTQKKQSKAPVELFVPEQVPLPMLPPLPDTRGQLFMNSKGKRGSATLDNAQLGAFLAKKSAIASPTPVDEMRALVGQKVWAQYAVDGKWYSAVVENFSPIEGMLLVVFADYGNRQYCRRDQVTFTDPNVRISPPPSPPSSPPASPPPLSLPQAVPRPEALPRPSSPRSNAATTMVRSTPTVPQLRPRPLKQSAEGDLCSPPKGAPESVSPRSGMVRAHTVMSVRPADRVDPPPRKTDAPAVAPRKSDSPAPSPSSPTLSHVPNSSPTLSRPAPAPRPNVRSATFVPIALPARSSADSPVVTARGPASAAENIASIPSLPQLPRTVLPHLVPSPRVVASAPASVIETEGGSKNEKKEQKKKKKKERN